MLSMVILVAEKLEPCRAAMLIREWPLRPALELLEQTDAAGTKRPTLGNCVWGNAHIFVSLNENGIIASGRLVRLQASALSLNTGFRCCSFRVILVTAALAASTAAA